MSTLVNKNVMVDGHRTSMRLEPEMWEALHDICEIENMKLSKVTTLVNQRRQGASLTSAMRVFIIAYFRAAAMADTRGMQVNNMSYSSLATASGGGGVSSTVKASMGQRSLLQQALDMRRPDSVASATDSNSHSVNTTEPVRLSPTTRSFQ